MEKMESELNKMKVSELKYELGKRGLSKSGLKADLLARLTEALKKEKGQSDEHAKEEEEETKTKRPRVVDTENQEIKKKAKKEKKADKDEDSLRFEFLKPREGPQFAELEHTKDSKHLQLTNKNLEASNSSHAYYGLQHVKGNISIRSGKWYFEVKIFGYNSIHIGWCTSEYFSKKGEKKGWVFDPFSAQKIKFSGDIPEQSSYGNVHSSSGEIIGCALDRDLKTMSFYLNGKDLGVAFNDVDSLELLSPMIALSSLGRCICNFGAEPFAYPVEGYSTFHSFLSDEQFDLLKDLFKKYCELSNAENGDSKEFKMSIFGSGLQEFQKDLDAKEEDPDLLIISWKLRCRTAFEISQEEFMNGLSTNGCCSVEDLKEKVVQWKNDLKVKDGSFKQFYNFVFDYLREGKMILSLEMAEVAWSLVLKERSWKLYPEFLKFLKEKNKKAISRDAWQMLFHFMQTYKESIKDYDSSASWPLLYDEFFEYMEAKA